MARVAVAGLIAHMLGPAFPWGTMTVNATGALAIGAFAGALDAGLLGGWTQAWPLVVTGFLGSYTTVSSFSLQTLSLVHAREPMRAIGNVLLTLVLCLGGVVAGYLVAGATLAVRVS